MNRLFFPLLFVLALLASCSEAPKTEKAPQDAVEEEEITLYTHRHYDTDKAIIQKFTEETGIKVNVVKASADALMQKMESEGDQSPADLLITVDAGRLVRAKTKGLLQAAESEALMKMVPEHLRDTDNHWYGLTKRARVIVYDKEKVDPATLSTYENLVEPQWNGKILIRPSSNIYNQSMLASIIAHHGNEEAKTWAAGVLQNLARKPKGNDRDQVKAIMAGEGELAVINTYYLGKLLNSKDADEVKAGEAVAIFFPNQDDRGTHVNISGIGVAKYAPNKENAIRFIEYLLSKEVQETFAQTNYEYPVNPGANISELLQSWGTFKEDNLSLTKLGELNKDAVILFDEVAWDNGPTS
ncbi:MAG: Fe(3+) ABC transporter substrate-binding protein [Salibacteraceae bacterium]